MFLLKDLDAGYTVPSVSKVLRPWADAGLWEAWQVESICIIYCNICNGAHSQLGSQGSASEEKEKETLKTTTTNNPKHFVGCISMLAL